ncbi:uncharacterized protein LOC112685735 [Sipha flava]|uniref:Uncharacterized protein LOC112685735 n=1 Tax=Sipha flava TaxID=143950 RepID=A0A8B8FRA9_9HEMI|nr:uncharacterized protein LOC112685735 [Sipha flava]
MNLSHNERVVLLKHDILNCPYHVFGYHDDCASYFCKGLKENEVNLVPQMQTSGLWADILGARNIVAHYVSSLIYNVNNNVVEGFNNVIVKYVGGKRINYSLRGSYSARCHTAVTSFNFGSNYISHLHKKMTNLSPGIITKKYIKKVDKMCELSRRRRLNFKKSTFTMNKRKLFSGPDDDYGAVEMGCEIIDMPFDEYQNKKELFLKKITLKSEEIVAIERSTIGQQDNDMWQQYRKYRLTASNFGKVCKLRPTTSRANTVKHILYDIFQGSSATRYGIENESITRNAVQETLGITIQLAGLFIHKSLHYLAASPDGLINEDSIMEIKCPSSIKEYTPQEAVTLEKLKYMTDYKGKLVIKKTDNYYFQVQGQLNIAEKKYCYFVVWSPKGFVIDKIFRDESFWNTKIELFVTRFYMESLLPEIIDSRFDRGLSIRPGIPEKIV